MRKALSLITLTVLAAFWGAAPASAQYGVGPVRIILPFSPGGAIDALGRIIAERIQTATGKPATVENITGASGHIGIRAVKEAKPDGSVLLITPSSPMVLHQHFFGDRLIFDPFGDFAPISIAVTSDYAMAVAQSVPANNVKELVAWLKEDQKRASYGTPGAGALTHFMGLEFGRRVGVQMEHVPYRGSPPALTDLVGGQIPMAFLNTSEFVPHVKAGTVKMIGTFTEGPSPFVSGVPTMKSQGVDIVGVSWYAFYAPAKTPPDVIAKLNKIIVDTVNEPEMKKKLFDMGVESAGTTPEEVTRIQQRDKDYWGPAVKASGWKPE